MDKKNKTYDKIGKSCRLQVNISSLLLEEICRPCYSTCTTTNLAAKICPLIGSKLNNNTLGK